MLPIHTSESQFQRIHELPLIEGLKSSIERLYENGKPLHHLPSARSIVYDSTDPKTSSIFVVDKKTFGMMTASEIQSIFRYRHILVHGVDTDGMQFDLEGLSTVGSVTLPREMQGEY
jgi:hypothetical protein